MMDWDKLRVFYTVAQAKSLTRAGEKLALSQSAVSRQISGLEELLKVTLFHRHARGLVLTEQGEILYKTVTDIVGRLNETETLLSESTDKPKGPFRITAPVALGTVWLAPAIKEFLALYPDIEVTLLVDDKEMDLAMREADVAIRMYPSKHPDLIQKPLLKLQNAIYASNDYLQEYGMPESVADLVNHRIISYPHYIPAPFPKINWLFDHPELKKLKVHPYLVVNSLNAIRRAVKVGMGIAPLPEYMMYRARHISKVLPDLQAPATEAYYVYPLELKNSRRVAVFKNFIERKLTEQAIGNAF